MGVMPSSVLVRVPVVFLLLCGACGGSSSVGAGSRQPCPSPTAVRAELPGDLPLDEWATIVTVEQRAGFVGAEAVTTDTLIVELYPEIVRTLTEDGYTLLGGDNEGFEAEISFNDPRGNYLNFILRQGSCKDEVRVRVLIEMIGEKG